MAVSPSPVTAVDPVWHRIHAEATAAVAAEPLMGGLVHKWYFAPSKALRMRWRTVSR